MLTALHMARRAACGAALAAALLALAACNSSSSSDSPDTSQNPNSQTPTPSLSVAVSGAIPASAVAMSLRERDAGLWARIRRMLAPRPAWAQATPTVDTLLGFSNTGDVFTGTVNADGTFAITLDSGKLYLLAFYEGTTFRFAYGFSPTDLDSLPLTNTETDLSLGDLAISGNRVEPSEDPAGTLALTAEEEAILTQFDQNLYRLLNVDVDGDGTFDGEQNRRYQLDYKIHIQGGNLSATETAPSDPANYTLVGYDFQAGLSREDWPADAMGVDVDPGFDVGLPLGLLLPPTQVLIASSPASPIAGQDEDCDQRLNATMLAYVFYCGGAAVSPESVPGGTYTVRVSNGYRNQGQILGTDGTTGSVTPYPGNDGAGTWATDYVFRNYPTVSLGTVQGGPRPSVQIHLTAGGAIDSVTYQWRLYDTTAAAWRDMTDGEVAAYLGPHSLSIQMLRTESDVVQVNATGPKATETLTVADPPLLASLEWLAAVYEDFTNIIVIVSFSDGSGVASL